MENSSSNLYKLNNEIERLNYIKINYNKKIYHIAGFGGERVLIVRDDEMIGLFDLDYYPEIIKNVSNLSQEEISFLQDRIKQLESEYIELNKKLNSEIGNIKAKYKDSISAELLCSMGIIYEFDGEFNNAREMYVKALSKNNDHALAKFNLGKIQFSFNELDTSKDNLENAIISGLNPQNKREALTFLAFIEIANNNEKKARQYFEQAGEEFPNDPETFYNLGNYYYKQKEYEPALDNFYKAINLYDDNTQTLGRKRKTTILAANILLYIKKNPKEAVNILETSLKIDPIALQLNENYEKLLAKAYLDCNNKEQARDVEIRKSKISRPSALHKKYKNKLNSKKRFNILFYLLIIAGIAIILIFIINFLIK